MMDGRKRRKEEARQVRQGTEEEEKERGNEAGRRKRGLAPPYSNNSGASARLCLTREKNSISCLRIAKVAVS